MSMPMVLSIVIALAVLAVLVGVVIVSRKRATALLGVDSPGEGVGIDRESFADHYRPMSKILDPREMDACRSLRGLSSSDFARFRAARISAFRRYLREMTLDFRRIEFKLRYLMLAASKDEAELVTSLNRIKSNFQVQLMRVRLQVWLFQFGWGSIDIQPLVNLLDQMDASLMRRPEFPSSALA